jgi:peptidoglycan hydrolase-like protein with peptidoglycan-binding domain
VSENEDMPRISTSTTPAFIPSTSSQRAAFVPSGGSLKKGSTGASVVELQRSLAREGFDPGSVDGKFGPATERAVKAFQRARGLEVDGVAGRLTQAALSGGAAPTRPTPAPSGPSPVRPTPSGAPGDVTTSRSKTDSIGGVSTYKVSGKSGVAFKSGMTVDADGSPRAYHPRNIGLDALGNAGRPGNWWGIATNNGKPVVQGPNDPAPGYYVSTTALVDGRFKANDPRRYVNSEEIPFVAVPPKLKEQGVKLGDLVAVRNDRTGKTVFAVVADIGPRDHIGEGSIKLAQELGINADARRGGASSGVSYVVFPGSKQSWPLSHSQIQEQGKRLYDSFGGDAQLASAVR